MQSTESPESVHGQTLDSTAQAALGTYSRADPYDAVPEVVPTAEAVDEQVARNKGLMLRMSQFRSALMRGAKLLSRSDPEKSKLFKRGLVLVERGLKQRSSRALSVFLTFAFFLGAFTPMLMVADASTLSSSYDKGALASQSGEPSGSMDDFTLGAASANLTTTTAGSTITVWTEEYCIVVDYSSSFVDYKIKPYFCSDFIRYRRVNPQYAGDGVTDSNGNALDSVSMTISKWGRSGTTVWFLESCPEFSINQTFHVYRDYFELDATYKPGTKNVIATYFFALYSSSGSIYSLVSTSSNRYNRYVPGISETAPDSNGVGGWYPSFNMYAPVADIRATGKSLGAEWGYNETVAYIYSPIWMKDCGTGGASAFCLKYCSMNSIVPNVGLGTSKTFHMFVRPYKYTDGKDQGHAVAYAQWVAPKIASAWGSRSTPIFPLTVMSMSSYTPAFQTWLDNSQVKVATYSTNPNQINWNYKSSQISNTDPGTPSAVPTDWQLYISPGTPMTTPNGKVVCNPVSGPYTTSGTYRWQLINNDPYMSWWTGTRGVFWDEMNMWTATNQLRSDYQNRASFVYEGYLKLVSDTYASGYWDYVITNPFTSLLHLSMVSDLCCYEGYEASSDYGTSLVANVQSAMDFVNNIPTQYRPHIIVYQNYVTGSTSDQEAVYSALFGAAKYKFDVCLLSYDSYASQMHNLQMAEDMFEAMGCTRDSDTRIAVDTLDLAQSLTLSTSAAMVVMKGAGTSTITESSSVDAFKITNLHATSNAFNLRTPGSGYYLAGSGAQSVSPMTYSSDGYATFHGSVDAEKTATVSRSSDISVSQATTGTATVSLASKGPSADLTVGATGGVTSIILKGFTPGKSYDILVNGVAVDKKTAAADGSITFSRTYGSSDHVTTRESAQADTFPPHVNSCSPSSGATGVSVSTQVTMTFNESMDQAATQAAFALTAGSAVSGTFAWQDSSKTMVFTPSSPLSYSTSYTISLGTGAKDLAGNPISSSYSSSFTTEAKPFTPSPPGAPTSLSAASGLQKVSLSWTAPSSTGGAAISSYKVYRGTSAGGEASSPVATLGNVTSYDDNGLQNGLTYYYKVTAVNSAGEGNRSNEASATTPSAPSAPTSLSGVGGTRSNTISWSAPSSNGGSAVTGYKVYRGTVSGAEALIATIGATLSYTDSGLVNGTTYYYQVSALNAVGEGARCSEVSVTTSSFAPAAPTNMAAASGYRTLALSWSAPSSNGGSAITGYKLYRGTSSGALSPLVSLGNVLSYTDSGLANGTTYYYQVSAVNAIGEGARSSEFSGRPSIVVPAAPIGTAATGGLRNASLSWSAPSSDGGSPVTGYKVYRGTSSGQLSLIATLGSVLSFRDGGLADGTNYYYQVSALNSVGEGARSAEFTVTTLSVAPTYPLSFAVSKVGSGNLSLSWAAPASDGGDPVTGYRVYRGDSAGGETFLASTSACTYLDSGLVNGRTYYYQVTAVNGVGEGTRSPEASATVSAVAPSSPRGLVASAHDSYVTLVWFAPSSDGGSAVTGYKVYRGTSPGTETLLGSTAGELAYNDTAASNGQRYYYKVSALNAMGEGGMSSEANAMPVGLPGAPLNLQARAGNNAAALSWSEPASDGGSAVLGYNVYRGESPSSMALVASVADVRDYQDDGLQNGVAYYYSVSAFSQVGEGARAYADAVTPGFVPSEPLDLRATAGNGTVTLSWSAPSEDNGYPVSGYIVYRGTASGDMTAVATLGTVFTYSDSDVSNGITYYYRISARNSLGEGAFSSEASATPATVPSAPYQLVAQGQAFAVSLVWSAPLSDGGSAVTGYILSRGTQPGSLTPLARLGPVTSYTDSGLQQSTTYYYALQALNGMGGSGSSLASATTAGVPAAPSGATAAGSTGSVLVQWSAPANDGGSPISGYWVYRGESPSDMIELAYLSTGFSYSDPGLGPGITYYYAVSAVNAVGEGPLSQVLSATTNVIAPSSPLQLKVTAGQSALSLTWTAPQSDGGSPITSYRVYRASGSGALAPYATSTTTSYSDSAAVRGTSYRYAVSAMNAAGEGAQSQAASGTIVVAPGQATALQASKVRSSVVLTWSAPASNGGSAITSYVIYRGTSAGTEKRLTTTSAGTSYTDGNPPKSDWAYYRVAAANAAGEGQASNEASIALKTKPSSPSHVLASAADSMVTLSWQAPADDGGDNITGYLVYGSNESGALSYLATVQNTTFEQDGLDNGVSYSYSVSAINSIGEGNGSETVSATPLGSPDMPLSLTAIPYDGIVMLRWEPPSSTGGADIVAYRVYVSVNGTDSLVAELSGSNLSYICKELQNGVEYDFSVSAVGAAGEGARSLSSAATPIAGEPSDVSDGSASSSLLGGGIMTGLFAVSLFAAIFLYLAFWNGSRHGRRGAGEKSGPNTEEEEMKNEMVAAKESPQAAKPAQGQGTTAKPTGNMDTAFEDSLKELEEVGSRL